MGQYATSDVLRPAVIEAYDDLATYITEIVLWCSMETNYAVCQTSSPFGTFDSASCCPHADETRGKIAS